MKEVKCPHCSWERPRFWKNKKGRTKKGYNELLDHISKEHPDKMDELERLNDKRFAEFNRD